MPAIATRRPSGAKIRSGSGFRGASLTLKLRVSWLLWTRSLALQPSDAALQRIQALVQFGEVGPLDQPQVTERLGQARSGLLAAPSDLITGGLASARDLLAGGLPAPHDTLARGLAGPRDLLGRELATTGDLVEQTFGTLSGLRGGAGRGRQRPLHGRAQRLRGLVGGAAPFRAARGPFVGVGFDHRWSLFELPTSDQHLSWPTMSSYLRPMADTAPLGILCGDPARALAIAQRVLVQPRMSNHHRGLWGYYGRTPGDVELTVQATGIGGAGAAIVLGELAARGLLRAVRVGTARSTGASPPLGAALCAERIVACEGPSRSFGVDPGSELTPDGALTRALRQGIGATTTVYSFDRAQAGAQAVPAGAVHDLQSAGLLAAANELGVDLGVGLVVSADPRRPLEDEPLEAATLRLGDLAAGALVDESAPSRAF